MAKLLEAAFSLRALTYSPRVLRVTWGDGVESTYPSTWLRASVRDPVFFDSQTCEYLAEHFTFVSEGHPIAGAEQTDDRENVNVVWSDHTGSFSVPWLRVQDERNSSHLAEPVVKERLWTSADKDSLPEYHYSEKDHKFESMMKDLRRWGTLLVHECPTTDKGLLDFVQMIGVPMRRKSPVTTGIFNIRRSPDLDVGSQSQARAAQFVNFKPFVEAHTDSVDYTPQSRFACLLSVELDAPVKPTGTFIADGFKVAEDLRADDREAFDILSSTRYQHGRHRLAIEDDCEPSEVHFYEWNALTESSVIHTDGDDVKQLFTNRGRAVGLPPCVYDEDYTLKFYRAYKAFHSRLIDPYYRVDHVLKPGMLLIYDNYRLTHGRNEVHPTTHRFIKGLGIPEEGWRSRWRFLLSRWSGLEPRWCYGCSDEALNVLAQRKLLADS